MQNIWKQVPYHSEANKGASQEGHLPPRLMAPWFPRQAGAASRRRRSPLSMLQIDPPTRLASERKVNRLGPSASSPPSATTNSLRSSESQSEQPVDRQEHKAEIRNRKTKTKYGGCYNFVKLMLKMAKFYKVTSCCCAVKLWRNGEQFRWRLFRWNYWTVDTNTHPAMTCILMKSCSNSNDNIIKTGINNVVVMNWCRVGKVKNVTYGARFTSY
jgi:hypothetical protein